MATVTTFIDGTQETVDLETRYIKAENTLDFAATGAAAADVVQALKIPKGAFVKNVYTIVVTAEGATATADVGDATDPNGYNDACDFNATANTVEFGIAGTDAFVVNNGGKLYTAADTIDFTLDHTLDTAKITIVAEYFMIEQYS